VGLWTGIGRHEFADDAERDRCVMVAIEAVLVYWSEPSRYPGWTKSLEALGRTWRVTDFGYVE
jgi:hypothetical protein